MINKWLRTFGITEVILLFVTVLLYFATANANDYSGFIVMYPMYAMVGIGFIALVLFIVGLGTNKTIAQNSHKATIRKLLILVAVGYPVLSFVGGMTEGYGTGPANITLMYLCALGVFIVLNNKNHVMDVVLYIPLLLLPVFLVIEASHMDDPNIFTISIVVAALLVASTITSIAIRRPHNPSTK